MKTVGNTNLKTISVAVLMVVSFASTSVMAIGAGDLLINARLLNIAPDIGSNQVMVNGAPLAAPAGIDVDDGYSLGADITYMMTDNFGVELMLNTSSSHDISGTGNLAGVNVGEVSVLPPSLIAVWHFTPNNNVRPYAGAGINYTMFFNESTTSQFTSTMNAVAGPGVTSIDVSVDDTFSLIAQVGVDVDINNTWYVSFDAKYIDMDTTAKVRVNGVNTATIDFDVDPLILGVGVGTKF